MSGPRACLSRFGGLAAGMEEEQKRYLPREAAVHPAGGIDRRLPAGVPLLLCGIRTDGARRAHLRRGPRPARRCRQLGDTRHRLVGRRPAGANGLVRTHAPRTGTRSAQQRLDERASPAGTRCRPGGVRDDRGRVRLGARGLHGPADLRQAPPRWRRAEHRPDRRRSRCPARARQTRGQDGQLHHLHSAAAARRRYSDHALVDAGKGDSHLPHDVQPRGKGGDGAGTCTRPSGDSAGVPERDRINFGDGAPSLSTMDADKFYCGTMATVTFTGDVTPCSVIREGVGNVRLTPFRSIVATHLGELIHAPLHEDQGHAGALRLLREQLALLGLPGERIPLRRRCQRPRPHVLAHPVRQVRSRVSTRAEGVWSHGGWTSESRTSWRSTPDPEASCGKC